MKRRLITAALPYVNNIPHLGNLIQVLSADVFARFCRLKGYETLYVCGTDEYGTATETRALEENISPKELCDRYCKIHSEIYDWFNIEFDKFGRTSTPEQTEIVQSLFHKLDEAGYINEATIEQLYCIKCDRFLADRYVTGDCPFCGYTDARGDQCEDCGKLLDPTDLKNPRCGTCDTAPELRTTNHLYINLPEILPLLEKWMISASDKGFWARNAVAMTKSWIRDGLKERCITRDLKWGIPVPKDGYRDKVFYVWFDAPIGYISITASFREDWESWWKDPDNVELFQFIGKDNIPFHTVIFPSTLIGSGENWTLLHHMSSSEYLNYEDGKFSKSKGIGVFGNDARDTGIPADIWRFYIFYNRPEKSDTLFTWKDFQEKINSELIGNLGNLVNRTLTFVNRFFDGKVPDGKIDSDFSDKIGKIEEEITAHFERAELRDAFRKIFSLSDIGNKAFQEGEPWRTRTSEPGKAADLIRSLIYLVRDLGILIQPVLPDTAQRIAEFLGEPDMSWEVLNTYGQLSGIAKPKILFQRLEDDKVEELKTRFSGTQKEREEESPETVFANSVDLRVAKITAVTRHPEADKLYVETIDAGEDEPRQIVSGLVPHYSEDELLGRNIILVANLKPAKLRGVKSKGMLLAAEEDGVVEVLFADHAEPGTRVVLEGTENSVQEEVKRIKADAFFSIPILAKDKTVFVGNTPLVCGGELLRTESVKNGEVG